jgi:XTP/dITP diphosphohydrolase
MRIVLASGNAGKLAEIRHALADWPLDLVPQREMGVEDADETGLTFVENALLKARHAATRTGLPALADDSGLVIDALGGRPGLHSAHYAGAHGDHAANIARVLAEMAGMPTAVRAAHFISVVTFLRSADDPDPLIACGRWHGLILDAPRGHGGFGYDPIFLDPTTGLAAAEMDLASKRRLGHRGQALAALADLWSSASQRPPHEP